MSSTAVPMVHGRASKYLDRSFNRQAMKILPGEFYATTEDEVIVTVLGSCVAACVMDPIAMVGGMNHFMLPVKQGDRDPDVFFAARYGAAAMEYLINNLLHLGAQRDRLVAKAFGGGNVLPGMSSDVGGQNVAFVRTFLSNEGIPLWSEDMGGPHPRKVYFFPHTGQVLVKRMERAHNNTVLNRERSYINEFTGPSMAGEVELFS